VHDVASLNTMVKRVAGLQDTTDVSNWENKFIKSIVEKTRNGDDTRSLTEKQIDVLERIFNKHFAG
jgi:hypothetical protein